MEGFYSKEDLAAAVKKYRKYKLSRRAAAVAKFIEDYCTYTKGEAIGQPFRLLGWQFKVLKGMYPGNPGEKRKITRALVSIARKNGKTEFASALVLVHLCGPEAGHGQQIICAAASSEKQAALVWGGARQMLINREDVFNVKFGTSHSARHNGATILRDSLVWEPTKSSAQTIGTKVGSAQGLIPAFWTYDEIAETTDRKHYEALNFSDKASNGLGFIISTRSTRPDSVFTILHDEAVAGQRNGINKHWYVQVHSADPGASNLYSMTQVKKANPAAARGGMLDLEDLRRDLDNAKANPSARSEFRARVLNIESGDTDSLVDPVIWAKAGVPWQPEDSLYERMKGKPAVLAIDLGSTTSLTALAVYWPTEKLVSVKSWMAYSQVEHNETIHKAPYSTWAEDGHLELIGSDSIGDGMSYVPIAAHIDYCMKIFDVKSFRYDGWNMARLFDALRPFGLEEDRYPLKGVLDKFRQGPESYGEAITEFEDAMLNGTLNHDSNHVTTMGVNVCMVASVNRTNELTRVLAKNKQQLPNDPAIAIIMAHSKRGLVIEKKGVSDAILDEWYSEVEDEDEEALELFEED